MCSFFLLSEKRIRTHELCVRTYQVEIRHDFLFFCASVLNQNKDARAVRPYLTSVFHHSWQLFSVLYSSTFDHCVERSQSATMTFPSWLMMDHDLPFSIFVSPSEKSVIQL